MNDATVVTALMTGDAIFFFEHCELQTGEHPRKVHRSRETDDASADHHDVATLVRHDEETAGGAGKAKLSDRLRLLHRQGKDSVVLDPA